MKVIIRRAVKSDVPAMLRLIKELASYEKAPDEVTNTMKQMEQDGFGTHPLFHAQVAEAERKVVGMALYYVAYSTWKGKYVYLDDLIVQEEFRRYHIGRKLFDATVAFAKEQNAHQLRWHVLDWNQPAIEFYKKYHCSFDDEWITCKLSGEQLSV